MGQPNAIKTVDMWGGGGLWLLFLGQLGIRCLEEDECETKSGAKFKAIIAAIVKVTQRIVIFEDSKYVHNGEQGDAHKWRHNGWCGYKGPVPNSMLWGAQVQVIDLTPHLIRWAWSHCTRASLVMSKHTG